MPANDPQPGELWRQRGRMRRVVKLVTRATSARIYAEDPKPDRRWGYTFPWWMRKRNFLDIYEYAGKQR